MARSAKSLQHMLRVFAVAAIGMISSSAFAQSGGSGGSGGTSGGSGGFPIAGVEVDPDGVLRVREFDPAISAQRLEAARQTLAPELQVRSPLRKISLQRLEAAVAQRLADGEQPTDEMQALAGLTGIRFVFYYPDTKDIVLAGPAEGFAADASGRVRGISTGRSTLLLEDLVVALRAHGPKTSGSQVISVSIDPTPEGLARLQQFLNTIGGNATPAQTEMIASGLRDSLGMQHVSIRGVSPNTHFAQVLVEADYRMKLIGIGLERPPVRVKSYVDRASASSVAANALERWYFEPNYECVRVDEQGFAMELVGDGVKLIGENERVAADGSRSGSGKGNKASQAFTQEFTAKYPQIARAVSVYGQLKNLIDLSIAAAYIRQQDYYAQSGWQMPVFGNESQLAVETYTAPYQVETAVNAIWKGSRLMTPLGGGVQIQTARALESDRLLHDDAGQLAEQRAAQSLSNLADGQWWWD
jgi:hypothetical protein